MIIVQSISVIFIIFALILSMAATFTKALIAKRNLAFATFIAYNILTLSEVFIWHDFLVAAMWVIVAMLWLKAYKDAKKTVEEHTVVTVNIDGRNVKPLYYQRLNGEFKILFQEDDGRKEIACISRLPKGLMHHLKLSGAVKLGKTENINNYL